MVNEETKKYIEAMKSEGLKWEQVCDIAYRAAGSDLSPEYEEVFDFICHLYGKVYRYNISGEPIPVTE